LILLLVLIGALGVAAGKFFSMLDRIGTSWTRGLPVAGLFLAAAYIAGRRVIRVARTMRNGAEIRKGRGRHD
jgi:hypothetical protein